MTTGMIHVVAPFCVSSTVFVDYLCVFFTKETFRLLSTVCKIPPLRYRSQRIHGPTKLLRYWDSALLFTGSIARSATLPVFNLLRGRFCGGETRCTDGGEIWHGEPKVPSSVPNFIPIGATTRVWDPQNWNFYSYLAEMWNINAPQGRIPCAIFTKFAAFVRHFRLR